MLPSGSGCTDGPSDGSGAPTQAPAETPGEVNATLTRRSSSSLGTLGTLEHGEFSCVTMEPPWLNNLPNVSCIPTGTYQCHWHKSPRYGWVYAVLGVAGRSNILIHAGNIAQHTKGCVLLGQRVGRLAGQPAVLVSRVTVRRHAGMLDKTPFTLEVRDA